MLGYIVIIASILSKCMGIGIEYYDDNILQEERTEDFLSVVPFASKLGDEDILKNSNVSKNNVTNYLKSSNSIKYNMSDINPLQSRNGSLFVTNYYRHSLFNLSFNDNSLNFSSPKQTVFPTDTLKDYEYVYDDEVKPYNLRRILPKPEQDIQSMDSVPNIKTPLTEFYNLEPALNFLNLSHQYTHTSCNSVWYAIESIPCWDLPLLYGEFGKQKKSFNIFLMQGGEAKNVVEEKYVEEKQHTSEMTNIPLTYYTNKWCKTAPCYGDHTLCLFSDSNNIGMCEEGYKVYVPDNSEQIALVNSLNSMRNKVANGESGRYSHLPPAANMNQITYDNDLENFARVWLLQCLPGPQPCSALDGTFVTQLECTKFAKFCCVKSFSAQFKKCIPKPECFTPPLIGCLHVWYWNAGDNLTHTDIECGHSSVLSYSTVQILWASTLKIGCAFGKYSNGDIRVICNFSPGAPFILDTRYYCGILDLKGGKIIKNEHNIRNADFLKTYGININQNTEISEVERKNVIGSENSKLSFDEQTNDFWGIEVLHKMFLQDRLKKELKEYKNGSRDMIARLVLKYTFIELNGARCDSDEPVYLTGDPGSLCVEKGRRYKSLCYNYRDPTPGYRMVAVIAPMALFFLILYDLFSGVVRQRNC